MSICLEHIHFPNVPDCLCFVRHKILCFLEYLNIKVI